MHTLAELKTWDRSSRWYWDIRKALAQRVRTGLIDPQVGHDADSVLTKYAHAGALVQESFDHCCRHQAGLRQTASSH